MSVCTRLTAKEGGLLVVDMQQRLLDLIPDASLITFNVRRLIQAARALGIHVWATEQYPKGLGPTVESIAALIPDRPSKAAFSCCAIPSLVEQLLARRLRHLTVVGIETHVCVAQTVLDLLQHGLVVQIAADAVGSRKAFDTEIAMRRLERAGAVIGTTESVMFDWVETSDHPAFKAISALVKEAPPAR